MAPLVSVLMPVRNGLPWLEEALCGLSMQTLRDIEILALEDGSTDASPLLLAGWPDARLRVIPTGGAGVGAALNAGLREARAPYVARQDADDVSLPERLERQIAFLEQHRDVDVVACTAEYLDARGSHLESAWVDTIRRQQDPAVTPHQIRDLMPLTCCITHGSVVARTAVLRRAGGYRAEMVPAEDYDLWLRLLPGARFAKVPERLYQYRVHGDQVMSTARDRQLTQTLLAKLAYLRRVAPELPAHARLAVAGESRGAARWRSIADECGFRVVSEGAVWDVLVVADFGEVDTWSAMLTDGGAAGPVVRHGNMFVQHHARRLAEAA